MANEEQTMRGRRQVPRPLLVVAIIAAVLLFALWLAGTFPSSTQTGMRPAERAELERQLELERARLRYRLELLSCVNARGPAELARYAAGKNRVRRARDTPLPGRPADRSSLLDASPATRLLAGQVQRMERMGESDLEYKIREIRLRGLQLAEILPLERIQKAREDHPGHPCLQKPWPR